MRGICQTNHGAPFKKELVKTFIKQVKDPYFRNKLVVTFGLNSLSFTLKTPTKDYKLGSVDHIKDSKKYENSLMLPEVIYFCW
jgi:hypothetical protein